MQNSKLEAQEDSDRTLIEDVNEINYTHFGEGAVACHVCGAKLREGDRLTAFAFRPADRIAFELAHVKCTDCRHEPTEYTTLGVRELLLDGRVGTCTDQATQSSWPVLLAPQPRAVSPAETTALHALSGATVVRRPIARSDHYAAADQATSKNPWQRAVVRADCPPHKHTTTAREADVDTDTDPEMDTDTATQTATPTASDTHTQTTPDPDPDPDPAPTHTDVVIEPSHADHHCGGPQ